MKFLPLRDFDDVTTALNFHTPDCQVIGGCDLYTTKAAGSDKKLYRDIENSLESQYESLVRLTASVSPPQLDPSAPPFIISRSSPFGSLSQVSSRRTFAYLIATLNASHPDYDFSHNLRPGDFRRERSLKAVMNTIDTTLYNLRPSSGMTLHVPSQTSYVTASSAPVASQAWGPQMWSLIDKEMSLKECTVYCWDPPDEPFDGEEGSIWSLNYFFFNKERKRVAYVYLRGVPVLGPSPRPRNGMSKRGLSSNATGANKRAKYWLGDQAANVTNPQEEEDDTMWDDERADDPDAMFDDDDFCDTYDDDAEEDSDEQDDRDWKASVRGVSEDIAASMDMDV